MVGLILLAAMAFAILATHSGISPMLTVVMEEAATSRGALWTLLLLYTILLAMPFVPGAEIGLTLLVLFGAVMAWPVYLATVLALSIAFAVGRLASRYPPACARTLPRPDALMAFPETLRDRPWLHRLTRFRWLAVVALINMPGNTVLGGGGGIAMAIGYSRTISYPAFLACAAVAAAPVPALVLLGDLTGFGERLSQWVGHVA